MPAALPRRRAVVARPKGAPRTLTRAVIVDAALPLLDAEGLDAVTMRRVAEVLDTGPASLYAHVAHKDDLVEALLERVIAELDLSDPPDPDRWQEQLKQFARDTRAVFARHGDIARASLGRIPTGPNALSAAEWVLSVVRAGGASEQVAAWTIDILTLYVGAIAYEESLEQVMFNDEVELAEYHAHVHERFLSLDAARFPTMTALGPALVAGDGNERFEFGLDILVRGIASTIHPG